MGHSLGFIARALRRRETRLILGNPACDEWCDFGCLTWCLVSGS